MKQNQQRKTKKKQSGFLGLGVVEIIAIIAGVLALGSLIVYPAIKNFNENTEATKIISGLAIINEAVAATDYGTVSNYTGLTWSDLPNFLPVGFLQRAANGSDYDVAVNTDTTKFDTSITISNDRVLDRVKAKYTPTQYTVTGNKFTVTGP